MERGDRGQRWRWLVFAVLACACAWAAPVHAQSSAAQAGGAATVGTEASSAERYRPERPPGPFDRGRIRLGLGLGWASGVDTDWLILGLGGGYFVVDGLELGLDTTFWVIGDPFVATLTPGVRYVLHFVPFVKPYVGTFYRRYFLADGRDDSDALGVRGGLYFTISQRAYFGGGVIYERFLDQNLYAEQDQVYPELSVALAF